MWLKNLFKKKKQWKKDYYDYDYDLYDHLVLLTARQWYRIYRGENGSHPSFDGSYSFILSGLKKAYVYHDEWEYYHHIKVQKFNTELCNTEILEEC